MRERDPAPPARICRFLLARLLKEILPQAYISGLRSTIDLMKSLMPSHALRVSGEVAEIFEKDGRNVARIVLKSGCIDVSSADIGDAHLGDHVLIDLDITIQHVAHEDTFAGLTPADET